MPALKTEATLRDCALRLLARREHSRKELERKLRQRGYEKQSVTSLLDNLECSDLLNDERFLASFIRSKCSLGFGPLKISAQLQMHGIHFARLRSNEEWQNVQWEEIALRVKNKRFGEIILEDPQKRIQQARFLQQRGFTPEQIRIATNTVFQE